MIDNKIIITGAMGAGKSSILKQLVNRYDVINEPARQILAEQRAIAGRGVPETDDKLFTELLLSRAINQYQQCNDEHKIYLFDRGIADNLAYANLFGFEFSSVLNAAKIYRYNSKVFFLSAWPEMYTTDDERKMTFEQSQAFGDDLRRIYQDLDYSIIDVPNVSIEQRVAFIKEYL